MVWPYVWVPVKVTATVKVTPWQPFGVLTARVTADGTETAPEVPLAGTLIGVPSAPPAPRVRFDAGQFAWSDDVTEP